LLLFSAVFMGHTVLANQYTLGPGDIISIRVVGEPEFSDAKLVIDDRGFIRMNILGKVKIGGKNVEESSQHLKKVLEEGYLHSAVVTVNVIEHNSKTFTVIGRAPKPGKYPIKGTLKLIEAVNMAGGFEKDGDTDIFLIRVVKKKEADRSIASVKPGISLQTEEFLDKGKRIKQTYKISLDNSLTNIAANYFPIRNGDQIFIPKRKQVSVIGAVVNPGEKFYFEGMTVTDAIFAAGGFNKNAVKDEVVIFRKIAGKPQKKIVVNVEEIEDNKTKNIELRPDDRVKIELEFY
jgi:polysaccharide export outer membrane protein